MEFVIKISQFLLSLSLLIVLHELGHFIPAKAFKTRVERFYLFFDIKYSLFKKKIGDTVYGIGWLPLGGYVKIAGMIDESMDKEQMAKPPEPWEFRSKPSWQRLIIMLGGVTVNFVLALIIYIFMSFAYGETDISTDSIKDGYWITNPIISEFGLETGDKILNVNGVNYENLTDLKKSFIDAEYLTVQKADNSIKSLSVTEGFLGSVTESEDKTFINLRLPFIVEKIPDTSLNANSGLKQGDFIFKLNDIELKYFDQYIDFLKKHASQSLNAVVLRDGMEVNLKLKVNEEGKFGIIKGGSIQEIEKLGYLKVINKQYSFIESFPAGFSRFKKEIAFYGTQLKVIFTPSTGAYKGVGGFKAIYDIFPDTWSWQSFWAITAFLSIMLAVLNLLPIPALDGGHVMFLLYEMVSQRKPSEKVLERAQIVGFFILIALVLFANGNDIFKAIFK